MHRISYIEIQNFRACQSVSLPLDDFTPLVGQNNVGKSTILESLRWLLKPDARSSGDFADSKQPIVVTARIEGITAAILGLIPEPKHRTAIEPFCPNGVLWIRVTADGTTAKSLKQEVWDPAVVEADGKPKEWRPYPTGLPQAVSAILPEPLSIQAMKDVQMRWMSLISFDATWSAFLIERTTPRADSKSSKDYHANATAWADPKTKTVRMPEDLGAALKKNAKAKTLYDALSYTNKKEYVMWVVGAKREETRAARVKGTIEKLLAGSKNPSGR